MNTGGLLVFLFSNLRLRAVVTVRLMFLSKILNADTELVGVCAKLADLLQLSVISQIKKQVWANGAFANKDCIFGRFSFSLGPP